MIDAGADSPDNDEKTLVGPALPVGERGLGEVLVRAGKLRPEQLDDLLREQASEGGRLADLLVRRDVVSEVEVLRLLGEQLDLPINVDLKPEDCDAEFAAQIPINFAKQHKLMVVRRANDAALLAVADPLSVHAIDDVEQQIGLPVDLVLVPAPKILEAINKVYARQAGGDELAKGEDEDEMGGEAEELVDILDLTDEAPIIRWVNSIMFQSVKERASDIHIEPREKELVVRYRIDGNLQEWKRANRQYTNSIVARIKIMAGLNIAE